MAHELDFSRRTGIANMFSVRQTPWHNEGHLLTEAPSFEEALRIAELDYEVTTVPIYVEALDGTGKMQKSETGRAIIRMDRPSEELDRVLAIRSDLYVPISNRIAFSPLIPLLDKGVAFLETGGVLRGGRDAWLLVRFNIMDPVVQEVLGTEVVPFGLISNNHSGEGKVLVMQTPIRVVCANTLGMATVGWKERMDVVAVPHRGDTAVKVIEASERLFGGVVERYQVIASQYKVMKETILTVEEFTKSVLDNASPFPPPVATFEGEHLTTRGYDSAYAVAENRRAAITRAWEQGAGHTGDHSAWEAYNGAVEVIDHHADLFRARGSRVASLMGGRLLERKEAVLKGVLEYATVGRN